MATPVVWEELGLQLFADLCLMMAASFGNAIAASQGLHKLVAMDAIRLAANHGMDNWLRGLHSQLLDIGYKQQLSVLDMHPIKIVTLRSRLAARRAAAWSCLGVCPRTCASAGARLCTYRQWFQRPPGNNMQLLRQPLPSSVMRTLLRFRMGSHSLPNLTGSWACILCDQRVCSLCRLTFPGREACGI